MTISAIIVMVICVAANWGFAGYVFYRIGTAEKRNKKGNK